MRFPIDPILVERDEEGRIEHRYFLASVAGGAAPRGYFSELSIMRETHDLYQPEVMNPVAVHFRRFDATSEWYSDVDLVVELDDEADAYLDEWIECHDGRGTSWLVGKIYGDQKGRFRDGESITTSQLKQLDREKELAYTQNTVYQLGAEKNLAKVIPSKYDDLPSDVEPPEENEKVVAEIKWPSVEMAGGHPLGAIHYGNNQVDMDRVRKNGPQGLMQEPQE